MIIIILITIAFTLDMYLTYCYAQEYKKRFPDRDWTIVEANPIIRNSWRKMGMDNGSLFSFFIICIILFTIIKLISENWHYFLFGIYFMMCVFHYTNFNALRRLKK